MHFCSNAGRCGRSDARITASPWLTAAAQPCIPAWCRAIAGLYQREELAIDLRQLCDRAGVAFVEAEITGLHPEQKRLHLRDRPALHFDWLSLNVGAVSRPSTRGFPSNRWKPRSLSSIKKTYRSQATEGRRSRSCGHRSVLALRRRWPQRALQLKQRKDNWINCPNSPAKCPHHLDRRQHRLRRTQPALHGKPGARLAGDDWSCPGSRWPDPHRSPPKGRGSSMPIRQRRLCSDQRITPPGVRGVGGACRTPLGHQSGSGMPGATPSAMASPA